MRIKLLLVFALYLSIITTSSAQGKLSGSLTVEGTPTEFAQISLKESTIGTTTHMDGSWEIEGVPYGKHIIIASYLGYESLEREVTLSEVQPSITLDFDLSETSIEMDQVVITGTKTFKRKTNSPVIVSVMNKEAIQNVQACNLSESLRFQSGLRVETDCQTCNYTQLRMNGLAGGYSQILINGRPIFSPLTGLYGLEQIPANMIDRIEVVKGGGSSLYGSSAVGGTVNVITTHPSKNSYALDYTYQNIDNQTHDRLLNGNATLVAKNRKTGASIFTNYRNRGFYDANGDNFSEIPHIENKAFGTNLFWRPSENQKLELSASYINEYRFGGEMISSDLPAHLADQSEERTHDVYMSSLDYQNNFNDDNSSFIAYVAWQRTDRKHYTGIAPDKGTEEYEAFLLDPPYGTSKVKTYNVGTQLNHKIPMGAGDNIFTLGAEYIYDDVNDVIPAYNYKIDQTTKNFGSFLQSDWEVLPHLTLLSGVRMDLHNFVDNPIASPRASLLYKYLDNTQFRLSYGRGFRAPQAFDADLHIAFAGGGISRILFSPDLKQEKSDSYSASINYDKPTDHWIAGFTLEGFYNQLHDAFYLDPIGEDAFGELFEKKNGSGATVKGVTLEARANYDKKIQIEAGFTLQSSRFAEAVSYIDGVAGTRDFTRTPEKYGYTVLTLMPTDRLKANISYLYTGSMLLPHFGGTPTQLNDEMVTSDPFSELGLKVAYTLPIGYKSNAVEIFGGVKNIFNSYQDDFDIGKNRDSNYIYGAAQPRTLFIGIKMKG